jgi:hypothetical protein
MMICQRSLRAGRMPAFRRDAYANGVYDFSLGAAVWP